MNLLKENMHWEKKKQFFFRNSISRFQIGQKYMYAYVTGLNKDLKKKKRVSLCFRYPEGHIPMNPPKKLLFPKSGVSF